MGKLTALSVDRLPSGMHADGDGLYLQVSGIGARSWVFRYSVNSKERYLGLGSATAIKLKRARELAAEARRLRAEGVDPIERRKEQRAAEQVEQAKAVTFKECADAYIVAHEASWRNAKHRQQWRNSLATYVHPLIGALPVQAIDTALVMKIVEPLWREKPETASRVRNRIELILNYATARNYRHGDNPARWRGHIAMMLPKRSKVAKVKHHAALPFAELPAFMADLRGRSSTSAQCLEFVILTAARTSEAIGATWGEIDLTKKTWTIAASRMKGGKEHRVPLSARAVEILSERPAHHENDYVFPGMHGGRPLSNMAMLAMLRVMKRRDLTAHGFRSTFKDWCRDCTRFENYVSEAALAHASGDKVEAAYARSDVLDKRRALMNAWNEFCATSAPTGNKVVGINSRLRKG